METVSDFPPPLDLEFSSRLPRLWIGYVIAVVGFVGAVVEFTLRAGSLDPAAALPVSYAITFWVGWIYWLYCVYRFHDAIVDVPGYNHPIAPSRAVAFHFIPLYNFYWVYKWPSAIAQFVNWRTQEQRMKGWLPGLFVLFAVLLRVVDVAIGFVVLFTAGVYISRNMKRAFAAPPVPDSAKYPPDTRGPLGL